MDTVKLLLPLLFLYLSSCNSNYQFTREEKAPIIISIDPNKAITDTIALSEIAYKIEYIPLQTNDSSYMGQILDYEITDDYFFVGWRGQISVYNKEGQYKGNLFRVGRGPGEVFARSYTVDKANKQVYVFSNFEHITKVYNFDRTFLKTIKKPLVDPNHWSADIFYFKNSLIVETLQNNDSKYLLSAFNLMTDSILVLYKDYTHGNEEINYPGRVQPIDAICYQNQDSVILFKEIFNDTVFKVTPSLKIEPYFLTEITNSKANRKEKIESIKNRQNAKGYYLHSFAESMSYIFFVLRSESDRQIFGIYNKLNDSVRLMTNENHYPNQKVYLRNDLDNIVPFNPMSGIGEIFSYDRCLYALVEGKTFKEGYKALNQPEKESTEYLRKMSYGFGMVSEFSNPVLMKVYLKHNP